jgi:hypothetical protein
MELSLERYAELRAELDLGADEEAVLYREGIAPLAWVRAKSTLLSRFAGDPEERRRFENLLAEKKRARRPPSEAPPSEGPGAIARLAYQAAGFAAMTPSVSEVDASWSELDAPVSGDAPISLSEIEAVSAPISSPIESAPSSLESSVADLVASSLAPESAPVQAIGGRPPLESVTVGAGDAREALRSLPFARAMSLSEPTFEDDAIAEAQAREDHEDASGPFPAADPGFLVATLRDEDSEEPPADSERTKLHRPVPRERTRPDLPQIADEPSSETRLNETQILRRDMVMRDPLPFRRDPASASEPPRALQPGVPSALPFRTAPLEALPDAFRERGTFDAVALPSQQALQQAAQQAQQALQQGPLPIPKAPTFDAPPLLAETTPPMAMPAYRPASAPPPPMPTAYGEPPASRPPPSHPPPSSLPPRSSDAHPFAAELHPIVPGLPVDLRPRPPLKSPGVLSRLRRAPEVVIELTPIEDAPRGTMEGTLPMREALPFSAPVPAAPAWPTRGPTLTLEQYAYLSAEIAVVPVIANEARSRFGFADEASYSVEVEEWQRAFAADPELYARYAWLFKGYRQTLSR